MDLMIEAKMKDQTVLRICRKYGITPDSKISYNLFFYLFICVSIIIFENKQEYPTNEPQALSDDEEMENQNVTLLGQARKKHNWKKVSKL